MTEIRFYLIITLVLAALAASLACEANAAASIQNITPSQGPITGGTEVTLTGSGFTGTTLSLDGNTIAPTSATDTQIVFQTPARDNGIATIKLSGSGPDAYTEYLYLPPSLQSLPPGYITTVMGIGTFRGDGRLATKAMVDASEPGFAITSDGSLLFDEPNNFVIRRVRPDGVIERYAGNGISGTSGDGGPARNALLGHPRGMALDSAGNLFFVDTGVANCIRRIDAKTGIITTVYGGKSAGFSGDGGSAVNAQFNEPIRIAFDGLGNLYVLDWGNVRIRKIDTQGTITTIAGTGTIGFSGDGGPATQATFDVGFRDYGDLAADSQGNVYLADTSNNRVRKIDGHTGVITTFAADLGQVRAVVTDGMDNVYVTATKNDPSAARILKLSPAGQLLQSWGKGIGISNDVADAATTPMCHISRLALDRSGNIVLGDPCAYHFQRINVSTGQLETIAGTGSHIIGEAGPALTTVLVDPGTDLLFLASGDLLISEGGNHRIRKMDQQGNLSNIAGSGIPWGAWEGAALQTYMPAVGLAQTPTGDIIVAQGSAGTARIDSSGNVHSLTDGIQRFTYGFAGDGGPALSAVTEQPWDVAADSAGNIYIADSNNNRIRRIDARTGIIDTIAGSGPSNGFENYGQGGYCGDGGPATQACLNTPYGIAVAPDGTLYIGENGQRIRKVTPDGTITTFFSGGGNRVRLNSSGNLFMGPLRIQPSGHAYWLLSDQSTSGLGDGGPASQGKFGGSNHDAGVAADREGNLFFSDPWIGRVRAIRYGAVIAEPGSTVALSGGDAQAAPLGTAFPVLLRITLNSPAGTLENGIRVDFAAPASGASCVFPGGGTGYSTLTDVNGEASATCTANLQTGAYSVTATPLALEQSVTFSLTNTADTVAPSLPNALKAAAITDTQIKLSWNAASDNVGVTSYKLYRDGTLLAALDNVTSYTDTVPSASTAYSYTLQACDAASNCTVQSSSATATPPGYTVALLQGWNLIGNSIDAPLDVVSAFGDVSKVITVWKWLQAGSNWAFFAPSLAGQQLVDYAAAKGYAVLSTLNAGEGFWVNAKAPFTVQLPAGTAVSSASFRNIAAGWNLISTGENKTPSEFYTALGFDVMTLWAWDALKANWYFHAPSLEAKGGTTLTNYINSKGYLDFASSNKTLGNGIGFWVNKP